MDGTVRCPYCHSRDLSKLPVPDGTNAPDTITYKCQMCRRTFNKTVLKDKKA